MLWYSEKVLKRRIGGITSWRLISDASWTCRINKSLSHHSFETFENIRNDSKAGASISRNADGTQGIFGAAGRVWATVLRTAPTLKSACATLWHVGMPNK